MELPMLNVGNTIPLFEALDSDGNPITSDDLLGSFAVLYFYPKDDTPGCTKEACDFRDKMPQFDDIGVLLLGISPDSAKSHQLFSQKYGLNFSLLCDEHKELCRLFGVLKEKETNGQKYISVERTTFIVDEKGIICWLERPVNVEGHGQRVIKALEELEQLRH
jgi:thioredoxin-dependent peroxiredoxin